MRIRIQEADIKSKRIRHHRNAWRLLRLDQIGERTMNAIRAAIHIGLVERARVPPAPLASLWRWCALCRARAAQRRDLAGLDDHTLKDIGISRAEAASEAAKPFWRP
jgi:uncharacterized protein YjiS (DUF1127 family)